VPAVPALMVVLWYPQRMLGNQTQVRTRAALDAALEMNEEHVPLNAKAACPDCGAASKLTRDVAGTLTHPCLGSGCSSQVTVGTACSACKTDMPSRLDCPSCGVNAPAMNFLPDQEAW
jgi:rubredoxin